MKIINFFGAPGAGKSTATFGLLSLMNKEQMKVAMVPEFAKELIYDGNQDLLKHQNYVFATQEYRQKRLLDKGIDFAVSDSPLLLSSFYSPPEYPQCFHDLVLNFFNQYNNINFFLNRSHPYSKIARIQTEDESNTIEETMKAYLANCGVSFIEIKASESAAEKIIQYLKEHYRI